MKEKIRNHEGKPYKGRKYFTLSYDDGLEQDKRIIALLKKYGIKATFNLNSGLFGQQLDMEYISTIGFRAVEKGSGKNGFFVKTAPCSRIPEDEIGQVYEGFEIATHSATHARLSDLSDKGLEDELLEDRKNLQHYTDIPVVGHAYPGGARSVEVENFLRENDFLYARTVVNTKGHTRKRFAFPENPLQWNPTCWHIDRDIEKLLDFFLSMPVGDEDMVFYMWGHGYELDFEAMKKRNFWYTFERMLDKAASDESVIKCTNAEAMKSHLSNIGRKQ